MEEEAERARIAEQEQAEQQQKEEEERQRAEQERLEQQQREEHELLQVQRRKAEEERMAQEEERRERQKVMILILFLHFLYIRHTNMIPPTQPYSVLTSFQFQKLDAILKRSSVKVDTAPKVN